MVGAAVDKAGCESVVTPGVNGTENGTATWNMTESPPTTGGGVMFDEETLCKIGVATCVSFFAGVIQVTPSSPLHF